MLQTDTACNERKDGESPTCMSRTSTVVTITSCLLIQATLGISYTFGNINPYLTSYLRNSTHDANLGYTDTLWITQTSGITSCLLMPTVGFFFNHMPKKLYIFIGILLYNISIACCYWSIKCSLLATAITYGAVGGASHAILYPAGVFFAIGWLPNKKGLVSGLTLAGFGAGAFAWNQLSTYYINKDNLQPDVRVKDDVYYSQPEVLDKVPSCFLLLSGVCGGIQLICLIVMCEPPPQKPSSIVLRTDSLSESEKLLYPQDDTSTQGDREKSYGTIADASVQISNEPENLHPFKVLKTRVFWTLWFINFLGQLSYAFITAFFKAYGQTFISDDHFLSLAAAISSVFNGLGRPFWGLMADKFSFRVVIICAQSMLAIFLATFVICEDTNRAMYFVWVCGMYFSMCGILTLIPPLVYNLFGSRYFNVNLGLLDSSGTPSAIFTTLLAPTLKNSFGWHGIYFIAFGAMFTSVLLNLSLSLGYRRTLPKHMLKSLSL